MILAQLVDAFGLGNIGGYSLIPVYQEIKAAGSAYEDDFDGSKDPLMELVKGVGRGISTATEGISDSLASLVNWTRGDRGHGDSAEDDGAEPEVEDAPTA